jgi:hypothetical protein
MKLEKVTRYRGHAVREPYTIAIATKQVFSSKVA